MRQHFVKISARGKRLVTTFLSRHRSDERLCGMFHGNSEDEVSTILARIRTGIFLEPETSCGALKPAPNPANGFVLPPPAEGSPLPSFGLFRTTASRSACDTREVWQCAQRFRGAWGADQVLSVRWRGVARLGPVGRTRGLASPHTQWEALCGCMARHGQNGILEGSKRFHLGPRPRGVLFPQPVGIPR